MWHGLWRRWNPHNIGAMRPRDVVVVLGWRRPEFLLMSLRKVLAAAVKGP